MMREAMAHMGDLTYHTPQQLLKLLDPHVINGHNSFALVFQRLQKNVVCVFGPRALESQAANTAAARLPSLSIRTVTRSCLQH